MKLSLGPILTHRSPEALADFYARAASWPVDRVYLGEVVCSRRRSFRVGDWIGTAARLADAGKEAVLSAQALMESEADLRTLRRLVDNERFLVEANDMGAVRLLAGNAPFVAGPHLNVASAETLALLASMGAVRWVPPVELSREMIAAIACERPDGLEIELFAWGRMPLAFSARCFTARHHDRPKDDCDFRCIDHPDGLEVKTRDGAPYLVLNGTQTQSWRTLDLASEIASMREIGIGAVRLSPPSANLETIVGVWRDAIDGAIAPDAASRALAPLAASERCNGYWHGRPGIERVGA
ncbi:MAG: U32 family peptidase [Burkholderiales bacterium]